MAWLIPRAQSQKRSVEWAISHNGDVYYEFQLNKDRTLSHQKSSGIPQWITEVFGIDYFSSVGAVHMNKDAPADFTECLGFKNIRNFEFSNKGNLKDISPLSKLTKLERVYFGKNPISDFSAIQNLTRLEEFSTFATELKDLRPIAKCRTLKTLQAHFTPVSDLSPLANHPSLTEVAITYAKVTDITPLMTIPTLKSLTITGCEIPEKQVWKLQLALPNCKVTQ